MHAEGRYSRQHSARPDQHRRHRHGRRHRRWLRREAVMSLPGSMQRALGRIEQTLVAEDPGLGLRFAVFTRLTRHDTLPGTEQLPGRLQRFARPAIILPLMVGTPAALLTATWLLPGRQPSPPAGTNVAARVMSPASRTASCSLGAAIKLDTTH